MDRIAAELNLTQAYGNMLPSDKSAFIKELQAKGHKVAFVGDGVNDSPSLSSSRYRIAMGGVLMWLLRHPMLY